MEIEGYQDLVEIGRGGYAVVYRAHQAAFGRPVAIKVLTTAGLSDTDRARFDREALAMGRLSWHPNIVVVHETGTTAAGLPYLVEEYLEGGSLGEKVRSRGPMDVADAVAAVIQLSAAVHTAHDADLLHRDIKPDNALIDTFGRIKLADFGIAAIADSTLTATGLVTATIAHAAPEVLNGAKATPQADVYSLGSTLYELLTRTAAFVREGEESIVPLVVRVTNEPVPNLADAGVPAPVADVVTKAMAKEPGARQVSALELGRELQSAQQELGLRVTDLAVRGKVEPRHDETIVGAPVVPDVVALTPPPAPVGSPPQPPTPPPTPVEALTTETQAGAIASTATGTVATPIVTPPPGTPADAGPAAPKGRSKLPLALGLVVLLVLAGVAFLALTGGDDGGTEGTDAVGDGPPDQGGGNAGSAGTAVEEPTVIETGGARPFRIAVNDEVAWVTNNDGTTVDLIDVGTNEVVQQAEIGGEPVGVTLVDDTAWVANSTGDSIVPIDAAGTVGTPIAVGGNPRTIAATADSLWVTLADDDEVGRVDRATGALVDTYDVGDEPRGVAAAEDGVWVVNRLSGDVTRLDPATGAVVTTIPLGGTPGTIALTADTVWVPDSEQQVVFPISRTDNSVGEPISLEDDPGGIVAADELVYVSRSATTTVSIIDATTGEVVGEIDSGVQPAGLAVADGDLWIANSGDDDVSRVPLG